MDIEDTFIMAACLFGLLMFYLAMSSIDNDREKYKQVCAKHILEYVDWNNNAISCFDPKTNQVKAFKNDV